MATVLSHKSKQICFASSSYGRECTYMYVCMFELLHTYVCKYCMHNVIVLIVVVWLLSGTVLPVQATEYSSDDIW